MAETLGMLCDKLTIVKLKEFHTQDDEKLQSLKKQSTQLQSEIDEYLENAVIGRVPLDQLIFASNKVFSKENMNVPDVADTIGTVFYQLADVNCRLWHEQEKVYEFEKVPATEKDGVVKQLAILNLERNKCIDAINQYFSALIRNNKR